MTYYILHGLNEDGAPEIIFGDYDLEIVKYEKEITSSLDFTQMRIKTLPSDSQATIDAWFKLRQNFYKNR